MKCSNCGCDNAENARFCQRCGSALAIDRHPLSERMLRLLNDNIFMTLCILYSVSTGFSLISGGVPIVGIIMTTFLWLVFAQRKNGIITPKHLRYISGTIFASYVINWVLCCIVAFCGLFLAVLPFTMNKVELWNIIYPEIDSYINGYFEDFTLITMNFYLLLVSAILIIIAIIGACLNVIGRRSIHRFVQSIYKNLECGQINLVRRGRAQVWMMVFGILNGVSAAIALTGGNMDSFLEEGCLSAVFIMSSVLVNKYFGNLK